MEKKNVALLVNAPQQPGWIHEVALWLRREEGLHISALIVAPAANPTGSSGLPWARNPLGTVARLETRMLETRHRAQLETRELRDSLPAGTPLIELSLTGTGADRAAADPIQLRELLDLRLDIILALGAPAIRGALASLPAHGVWMPVHGEMKDQDGVGHAGFWEVYQRADHTTVKLWRLGPTEESDELLDARSFNTEVFWLKNRARALSLGNLMIFDTLAAIVRPERRKPPAAGLQIHTAMARPRPVQWDGAAYLARQAWLASSMVLRRAMKRNVRWRIGMCPTDKQEIVTSDAAVLDPPKGRFFADPFVYTRGGQPFIFFEDYYFRERKGKISVATYVDGAFRFLGVVLDLPYHLSFPYIFEFAGDTYMVPETCGNRTIELWKCTGFPLKWELSATLMSEISAVDTIVFPHDGRWWLFTNIDRTDGLSHCDELFAFHAERPDSTRWEPHALNPIVNSPVKARNAGVILAPDGSVVRCAQTQGFQHYGKGVSLNRIELLTPTSYREADGPVHYPDFLHKPFASMHHWHHHGGHTVFDFAFME